MDWSLLQQLQPPLGAAPSGHIHTAIAIQRAQSISEIQGQYLWLQPARVHRHQTVHLPSPRRCPLPPTLWTPRAAECVSGAWAVAPCLRHAFAIRCFECHSCHALCGFRHTNLRASSDCTISCLGLHSRTRYPTPKLVSPMPYNGTKPYIVFSKKYKP